MNVDSDVNFVVVVVVAVVILIYVAHLLVVYSSSKDIVLSLSTASSVIEVDRAHHLPPPPHLQCHPQSHPPHPPFHPPLHPPPLLPSHTAPPKTATPSERVFAWIQEKDNFSSRQNKTGSSHEVTTEGTPFIVGLVVVVVLFAVAIVQSFCL